MKFFMLTPAHSGLADPDGELVELLKKAVLNRSGLMLVNTPGEADVVVVNENFSFKEQRYLERLLSDPIVSASPEKVYTINFDDCATGVLRGLYSSLPRTRFDERFHAAIPYFRYHNTEVFNASHPGPAPRFLAAWRGNVGSHRVRRRLVERWGGKAGFAVEATNSWYNHGTEEKARYVAMILDAKFSLCPAGLAPVSFRIFESMALGRAPVLIADHYVYPSGLDWPSFSVAVAERKVEELETLLLSREARAEAMGVKAREAWDRFFSRDRIGDYFLDQLTAVVDRAPHLSREDEIRRWRSWRLWARNGWTVPQRAWRKVRRALRSDLPTQPRR